MSPSRSAIRNGNVRGITAAVRERHDGVDFVDFVEEGGPELDQSVGNVRRQHAAICRREFVHRVL
jgi:hypothetical protein